MEEYHTTLKQNAFLMVFLDLEMAFGGFYSTPPDVSKIILHCTVCQKLV